jgi:hypothetical protein
LLDIDGVLCLDLEQRHAAETFYLPETGHLSLIDLPPRLPP